MNSFEISDLACDSPNALLGSWTLLKFMVLDLDLSYLDLGDAFALRLLVLSRKPFLDFFRSIGCCTSCQTMHDLSFETVRMWLPS